MELSAILIITGLTFDIVGVWLIAYDIIRRPKLIHITNALRGTRQGYEELMPEGVATGDTPDEIEHNRYREVWEKRIKALDEREERIQNIFSWRAIIYALIGLVIITIGFGLQIVGTVLQALTDDQKMSCFQMP